MGGGIGDEVADMLVLAVNRCLISSRFQEVKETLTWTDARCTIGGCSSISFPFVVGLLPWNESGLNTIIIAQIGSSHLPN